MWLNLSKIFTSLSHDPNIRSVVLTGAGERAFTAGLDVQVPLPSLPIRLTTPRRQHQKAKSTPPQPPMQHAKPPLCAATSSSSRTASAQSKSARSQLLPCCMGSASVWRSTCRWRAIFAFRPRRRSFRSRRLISVLRLILGLCPACRIPLGIIRG
jgi:hypothetical protein